MAKGGNTKHSGNATQQHHQHSNHKDEGDHNLRVTSSTSSQRSQSAVMGNRSPTNIPIEGGSGVIHCSGTVDSFNNLRQGSQDFSNARITSGMNSGPLNGASNTRAGTGSGENTSRSVTGTLSSFNNHGNGSQNFSGANISSGAYSRHS